MAGRPAILPVRGLMSVGSQIVMHATCLSLAATDVFARSYRICWLFAALRQHVSLWESITLNVAGDAASAVTPFRIAGEPVRIFGLLRARVPMATALVGATLETVIIWPVVILFGVLLFVMHTPETLSAGWRSFTGNAGWLGVAALALVLVTITWRRVRPIMPRHTAALRLALVRILQELRHLNLGSLFSTAILTAISLMSRVAILPVIALAMDIPISFSLLLIASYIMLHGQIFLPTPSGAGFLDVGFLSGMENQLGGEGAYVLIIWRFYTTILGFAIGLALGVPAYGVRPILNYLRDTRRRGHNHSLNVEKA